MGILRPRDVRLNTGQIRRAVHLAAIERPGSTFREISRLAGRDIGVVRRRARDLEQTGLLRFDKPGRGAIRVFPLTDPYIRACEACGLGTHPRALDVDAEGRQACEDCREISVNGIDRATWNRLLKIPAPVNGDHWSCVMRPGAWEWERPEAYRMRTLLEIAGYACEADAPGRPLGVRWKRSADRADRSSGRLGAARDSSARDGGVVQ